MPLSASIIARLQHQHETISELIKDFSEAELKTRVVPDKWSTFENIAHLASYQPTFIERERLMTTGSSPAFNRYIAENDPLFYDYLKRSLPELLRDIADKRAILIKDLQGLNEQQLGYKGVHPKFGTLTVGQWTDLFLLHEAHHLWTMVQLISPLRVARQ